VGRKSASDQGDPAPKRVAITTPSPSAPHQRAVGELFRILDPYVRAHGLAFDLFDRHPALGIPNAFGVPEPPERVHWDDALARAVGVPAAYDYGPERVSWLGHLVTNWMGDAGFLRRLNVQVRRHNLIGDTTWCRGTVRAKAVAEGQGEVTLDLRAVNQRGETIALGEAVVVLPRRGAGA